MKKLIFALLLTCLPVLGATAQDEDMSPEAPNAQFSLEDLKMFARLFEQVRQNYVEEVSDSELFEMAIQGIVA